MATPHFPPDPIPFRAGACITALRGVRALVPYLVVPYGYWVIPQRSIKLVIRAKAVVT